MLLAVIKIIFCSAAVLAVLYLLAIMPRILKKTRYFTL